MDVHARSTGPDDETIRTALALAARAPSVHNSQPWRWQVDGTGVQLFADPDRQLRHVDPDGRDMLVSCGATLHHAVVAFAALGWRATVRRLPDPATPHRLAALELCGCAVDQVEVALAAAIPRRRTDRRLFSSWPIAAGDIALMVARAARCGVMLRQLDSLDGLRVVVARAVAEHLTDDDYLAELTEWSGKYDSVSGVPARNTPIPDQQAVLPGRWFAGPTLAQPPGASAADDHSVLLVLGTEADDRLSWLRAGEATSTVLLTATALGLASCPVSEPLEIPQTRETVRWDVFGDSGFPQMLLRVGWAPVNADPLPATPRRALAEIIDGPRVATPPAAAPTSAAPSRHLVGCSP